MATFPDKFFPLLQENCTVTPGPLEDVFVETSVGRDRRLHATVEGKKAMYTVMREDCTVVGGDCGTNFHSLVGGGPTVPLSCRWQLSVLELAGNHAGM